MPSHWLCRRGGAHACPDLSARRRSESSEVLIIESCAQPASVVVSKTLRRDSVTGRSGVPAGRGPGRHGHGSPPAGLGRYSSCHGHVELRPGPEGPKALAAVGTAVTRDGGSMIMPVIRGIRRGRLVKSGGHGHGDRDHWTGNAATVSDNSISGPAREFAAVAGHVGLGLSDSNRHCRRRRDSDRR